MQQAVFDRGTDIGTLARQLFPNGINASPDLPKNYQGAIRYTAELVSQEYPVIYEAGFVHDGIYCFVDILTREEGKWHAYEVKSSTSLSHVYHLDAALQYHVMKNFGLDLKGIDIILLNNQYRREGPLDLHQLFTSHPVTTQAIKLERFVMEKIGELKNMMTKTDMPEIGIGPHCSDPYRCDFMGYCWKDIPDDSIFEVSGLVGKKKWELYHSGIISLVDIPDDFPLNISQKIQVESSRNGSVIWKVKEVKKFLSSLHYPLYFLDFESFQPAVPLFDRSKPYQQIPFQYSLHIIGEEGGPLEHKEFLAGTGEDPRPAFMESLIEDIGREGDIIVYNKSFEKQVLKDLSRDFPIYEAQARDMISRMKDLMEPFRLKHVYYPDMKGSYSIKNVFPALVEGSGYSDLEISDGGSASLAYEGMTHAMDPDQINTIRKDLLDYCRMDTLAMVRIWEALRGR